MTIENFFSPTLWADFFKDWRLFAQGFGLTVLIAIGALLLALLLGLVFAILGSSRNKLARLVARFYVEYYQNTPILVQFVLVYYGLPLISNFALMPSIYVTAVLCVGLYHGAYIAEVFRTGILAVPKGQLEAALSQGFSQLEALRHIIIPQAIRIILPPLANQAVNLIKNTSTVAIIGGVDIMFMTKHWSAVHANYIPPFLTAALLYFALCFPLARLARRYEEQQKQAY